MVSCRGSPNVCLWQILLQKSFWGDERKFLEPLTLIAVGVAVLA